MQSYNANNFSGNNFFSTDSYGEAKNSINHISKIDYSSYNPHEDLSTNILSVIEKEVEKLKRESEEYKKFKMSNKTNKQQLNESDKIKEDKVFTNYLCSKDDRIQAIKHVTTQSKAEYLSLEEIQKLREENQKKLLNIENEYFEIKKRTEQRANDVENFINREENKKISLEEINELLKNEEDYFQKDFKNPKANKNNNLNNKNKNISYDENGNIIKRKFLRRPTSKDIRRFSPREADKPLNRYEENYVKKYVNYVMKKKNNVFNSETKNYKRNRSLGDEQDFEEWNKTKVLSVNAKGGVNRNDNLPGHLYNDDYSFYYLSIQSENTPKSLSLKSFKSRSNSWYKKYPRKPNEKHLKKDYNLFTEQSANYSMSNNLQESNNNINTISGGMKVSNKQLRVQNNLNNTIKHNNSAINNNNNNNANANYMHTNTQNKSISIKQKSSMNAHLAFGKLIFQLLDKNKTGSVAKLELLKELDLDENILNDLGFYDQHNLFQSLQNFKTEKEGFLEEQEFIAFLLSRSDLNEQYLENYMNNNVDANMHDENHYDFNAEADMEMMGENKFFDGEENVEFESKLKLLNYLLYYVDRFFLNLKSQ